MVVMIVMIMLMMVVVMRGGRRPPFARSFSEVKCRSVYAAILSDEKHSVMRAARSDQHLYSFLRTVNQFYFGSTSTPLSSGLDAVDASN